MKRSAFIKLLAVAPACAVADAEAPAHRTLLIYDAAADVWYPAEFTDVKVGDWVIVVESDGSIPCLHARLVKEVVVYSVSDGGTCDDIGIESDIRVYLNIPGRI